MSLGRILFKLGIGRYPQHAEEIAAAMTSPAKSGLGALAETLERKAWGYKPETYTKIEFHNSPKPIKAQIDTANRDAMRMRTSSGNRNEFRGLGGEDVTVVDLSKDNMGRKYRSGFAERIDKLAEVARGGEMFAERNPYAIEALLAAAAAPVILSKGDDQLSPLEKLKARLNGI